MEDQESYSVEVTMLVSKQGKEIDRKRVDFGMLKEVRSRDSRVFFR